jgi:hypothetical protein
MGDWLRFGWQGCRQTCCQVRAASYHYPCYYNVTRPN